MIFLLSFHSFFLCSNSFLSLAQQLNYYKRPSSILMIPYFPYLPLFAFPTLFTCMGDILYSFCHPFFSAFYQMYIFLSTRSNFSYLHNVYIAFSFFLFFLSILSNILFYQQNAFIFFSCFLFISSSPFSLFQSHILFLIIIINYIYIALNTNTFLSALQKKYMLTYIYFNLTTIYFTKIDNWEYGHK